MRMIAVFEKSERLRHIGHLDIQRFVQRGLRRSGLPVAYSNGFNPHILVTFASALSTGACGKREIMDVTLAEPVTEAEFLRRMNAAMPPDMQLTEARAVEDRHPALMASLRAASYDILIRDREAADRLFAALPAMMDRERILSVRKTKSGLREVDIKPLIFALNAKGQHLYCTLALTEKEACKPNMLLDALCREAGMTEETGEASPGAVEVPEQGPDGPETGTEGPESAGAGEKNGRKRDRRGKRDDQRKTATDSFGNPTERTLTAPDRNGPVRTLVVRTALLGEDAHGVLMPLERL